ncbi:MAG TPA: response regulator transcription factor [Gemmataceae bacterium]|nr:response regulator transcription factor [Gemmataceae bacterium]
MSQTEAAELLKQAIALARAGEKAKARPLLHQVVEQDGANEAAWMWLASVAESPQEALSALERVLSLNPTQARARTAAHAARLQVGVAAAKARKKPRARALLRAVVEAEPSNEMAWMWLANVAESPTDAVECLEKVLALNPGNQLARATLERCRSAAGAARPIAPVAPSAVLADAAMRSNVGKIVVVVDDDPEARESIRTALEARGYRTHGAADGYEAVDWLREHGTPDLFLLAARLPGGMDGYQLCKILRQNTGTAAVPILLMSEIDSIIGKVRGRMAGAAAELVKPFEPEDLLRAVEQHCPPDEGEIGEPG